MYIGPSWALRSFAIPGENPPTSNDVLGLDYTNLAHELELDVINLAEFGFSNLTCYNRILNYPKPYDGVVWIYCEPIRDLGYNNSATIQDFITSANFWEIRKNINDVILKKMAELECPIALIGGHSDIEDCNYSNITVIDSSWQQFLAREADVDLPVGWGADVAHWKMFTKYPNLHPSKPLVELVCDTLDSWNKLQKKDLFMWVHPNRRATELFAGHIKSRLNTWLDSI